MYQLFAGDQIDSSSCSLTGLAYLPSVQKIIKLPRVIAEDAGALQVIAVTRDKITFRDSTPLTFSLADHTIAHEGSGSSHAFPFQVVKYDTFGHYHAHYDSDLSASPSTPCCHQTRDKSLPCKLCR